MTVQKFAVTHSVSIKSHYYYHDSFEWEIQLAKPCRLNACGHRSLTVGVNTIPKTRVPSLVETLEHLRESIVLFGYPHHLRTDEDYTAHLGRPVTRDEGREYHSARQLWVRANRFFGERALGELLECKKGGDPGE